MLSFEFFCHFVIDGKNIEVWDSKYQIIQCVHTLAFYCKTDTIPLSDLHHVCIKFSNLYVGPFATSYVVCFNKNRIFCPNWLVVPEILQSTCFDAS